MWGRSREARRVAASGMRLVGMLMAWDSADVKRMYLICSFAMAPFDQDGLRRTFRELRRHYADYNHRHMQVTGHLWLGWFLSVAMDEAHLMASRTHLAGVDDALHVVRPALDCVGDFAAYIGKTLDEAAEHAALRNAESVGDPIAPRQ